MRFAGVTSTVADISIVETLGHEMYVKSLGRRALRAEVHLWHLERCGGVMEQCVVSASVMRRATFQRLLTKMLQMLHACGHLVNIYHYRRMPSRHGCAPHLWPLWC